MAIYFVDSEQKRIIQYFDLHTSRSDTGLSAETKYQLDLHFNLTDSVEIKSDVSGNKVIGHSSSVALLDVICELILEIESTGEQKRMILKPVGNSRLYVNGNTIFSTPIDPRIVGHLNAWRKGRTLLIKWSISGQVAVTDSDQYFPILMINASNKNDNRNMLPSLDCSRFVSKILNPLNLSHTFLEVFPLEIPNTIKKAAGLPTGIGGLTADLFTLEEHLNNAADVLRNARTSYDYRHVMDEVKTALENIAAYPNKREL
jgi:hypothetical protein